MSLCEECGKTITRRRKKHAKYFKYCSEKCSLAHQKRVHREKYYSPHPLTWRCEICNWETKIDYNIREFPKKFEEAKKHECS